MSDSFLLVQKGKEQHRYSVLCQSQLYNVIGQKWLGTLTWALATFRTSVVFGLIFVVLMIARHPQQKPSGNSEGNLVYCSYVLEGPWHAWSHTVLSRECTGIMVSLIGIKVGPRASGFTLYC